MITTEKNKCILVYYLEFVKQNYEDISPGKEIIVGSFLASEESKETEANNFIQFSVVKRTAQKKKVETISQGNYIDIRKWFKEKKIFKVATNARNTEKRYNSSRNSLKINNALKDLVLKFVVLLRLHFSSIVLDLSFPTEGFSSDICSYLGHF